MITGKFDVTIEYNTFSEYGRDMYSILLTYGGPFQSRIASNTEKKMEKRKKERKWIRKIEQNDENYTITLVQTNWIEN